ncbi:hypothetical protein ABV409_14995 [Flagellimonas sp. DF-77]|uniref:hypothetical protein n=1 Tax=Flagellimonas algarum TaxID=3230298 RepID=UPI003392B065
MKKHGKTYLLLALVIAIWGLLGYKVVNGLGPKEPNLPLNTERPILTEATKTKREPLVIATDYRDPFLGTLSKATPAKSTQVSKKQADWPKKRIIYSGSVAATEQSNRMFFVSIEGKQHLMQRHQTIDGVKLLRGDQNAIHVRYPGHHETIKLSQ